MIWLQLAAETSKLGALQSVDYESGLTEYRNEVTMPTIGPANRHHGGAPR